VRCKEVLTSDVFRRIDKSQDMDGFALQLWLMFLDDVTKAIEAFYAPTRFSYCSLAGVGVNVYGIL
jgi:hypothetical protein